jgi:hypothetical protein
MAMMVGTAAPMYLGSNWNKGGMVTCAAKLGVMNYMLPMKFMEWAGRNQVTSKGRNSAGAGSNATFTEIDSKIQSGGDNAVHGDSGNAGNAWVLKEETFAVLADPWALNKIDDVNPSKGAPMTSFLKPGMILGTDQYHPLLDRSGHYYNRYAGDANDKAKKWFDESAISGSDGLLNKSIVFGAQYDGIGGLGGDAPSSLPVKYTKDDVKRSGDPTGYASGWADSRQSSVSSARSQYPWP